MLITIIYGWCKYGKSKKMSEQLNLTKKQINELTLSHSTNNKTINNTDPLKNPKLCIYNVKRDDKDIEYFGLKIFHGDESQADICLVPTDYQELERNLFELLSKNKWIVHYNNGKPLMYIACDTK